MPSEIRCTARSSEVMWHQGVKHCCLYMYTEAKTLLNFIPHWNISLNSRPVWRHSFGNRVALAIGMKWHTLAYRQGKRAFISRIFDEVTKVLIWIRMIYWCLVRYCCMKLTDMQITGSYLSSVKSSQVKSVYCQIYINISWTNTIWKIIHSSTNDNEGWLKHCLLVPRLKYSHLKRSMVALGG